MTTTLSTVLGDGPISRQLKNGDVAISGFELSFVKVDPIHRAFRRMTRELEFDVCEMAVVTYLTARQYGIPVTAIPVFPGVSFQHGSIVLNRNLVDSARDLEGLSIGVRAYTVTPGVWARSILAEEHGVDLTRVQYVLGDDEHVIEFNQDPAIPSNLHYRMGADLQQLLANGEVACGLQVSAGDHMHLQPLYEDPGSAAKAWYQRNNALQLSHLICVHDDVLRVHTDLPDALVDAFSQARANHFHTVGEPKLPWDEPMPIGLEQTGESLELLMRHAVDQQVLKDRMDIKSLFVGIA